MGRRPAHDHTRGGEGAHSVGPDRMAARERGGAEGHGEQILQFDREAICNEIEPRFAGNTGK